MKEWWGSCEIFPVSVIQHPLMLASQKLCAKKINKKKISISHWIDFDINYRRGKKKITEIPWVFFLLKAMKCSTLCRCCSGAAWRMAACRWGANLITVCNCTSRCADATVGARGPSALWAFKVFSVIFGGNSWWRTQKVFCVLFLFCSGGKSWKLQKTSWGYSRKINNYLIFHDVSHLVLQYWVV